MVKEKKLSRLTRLNEALMAQIQVHKRQETRAHKVHVTGTHVNSRHCCSTLGPYTGVWNTWYKALLQDREKVCINVWSSRLQGPACTRVTRLYACICIYMYICVQTQTHTHTCIAHICLVCSMKIGQAKLYYVQTNYTHVFDNQDWETCICSDTEMHT
jgi:hypothetical protein